MSRVHEALLISHSFLYALLLTFSWNVFRKINLGILWILHILIWFFMLQPLHILLLSSIYLLYIKNLLLFPHHYAVFLLIFYIFVTPFAFPTFKMDCMSIYHHFIYACHAYIQVSRWLHNGVFAIVFLSRGSFYQDWFMLIRPILLTMTSVFTRFTHRPFPSSARFHV